MSNAATCTLSAPSSLDEGLQAFAAAAGGDHAPARCGETLRGRGAEAGGRAGDQDGLGHG